MHSKQKGTNQIRHLKLFIGTNGIAFDNLRSMFWSTPPLWIITRLAVSSEGPSLLGNSVAITHTSQHWQVTQLAGWRGICSPLGNLGKSSLVMRCYLSTVANECI